MRVDLLHGRAFPTWHFDHSHIEIIFPLDIGLHMCWPTLNFIQANCSVYTAVECLVVTSVLTLEWYSQQVGSHTIDDYTTRSCCSLHVWFLIQVGRVPRVWTVLVRNLHPGCASWPIEVMAVVSVIRHWCYEAKISGLLCLTVTLSVRICLFEGTDLEASASCRLVDIRN